ncbi:phosphoribosylformylglycinamidine synthase, partial [Myxococcota bacterium]|nr:phosphoribosylformylglycinamidine synthase [Myxococcota bacterium]
MAIRIETGPKAGREDPVGKKFLALLSPELPGKIDDIRVCSIYTIDGDVPNPVLTTLANSALADPVIHDYSLRGPLHGSFDWVVEVDFKPGVTDNEGRTATESLALLLGTSPEKTPRIYSGRQFRITGDLTAGEVHDLADAYLANTLIHRIRIAGARDFERGNPLEANPPIVRLNHEPRVATLDLDRDDDTLTRMSRENVWALSVSEMHTIAAHVQSATFQSRRVAKGMPTAITDVEMECLAQSWSEHCKHKIFSADITYTEDGVTENIPGLFRSCIKATTEKIRQQKGKKDTCLSVFKDNAGVIKFNEKWGLVFKVETHNSPSALDPYGGSLTGIVGVNRDPFGTGMGARLLFNTNVFCLANPFRRDPVPMGLLHPHRILEGVREGVEHGGNQSGIPTINGSVVFDDRYLGKPLVYCGTGGLLPLILNGKSGYEKYPSPSDLVVMVGGRIGMDGIHGATFSSEELHDGSPSSAVQIGDPITQKRMFDFLEIARDRGLYSAITDNGAGGLSSSVGEMATLTGGATIDLAKAPLKYAGLDPWEILVSESQERMTLAIPPESIGEFMNLSALMNVESTVIGEFTDSGYLEIFFSDQPVADLHLGF